MGRPAINQSALPHNHCQITRTPESTQRTRATRPVTRWCIPFRCKNCSSRKTTGEQRAVRHKQHQHQQRAQNRGPKCTMENNFSFFVSATKANRPYALFHAPLTHTPVGFGDRQRVASMAFVNKIVDNGFLMRAVVDTRQTVTIHCASMD